MGNSLEQHDFHQAGYVDTELFQRIRYESHGLFGDIEILKLANKPKSMNTLNKLILNSDTLQLFMSISTRIPKIGLNQIFKGVQKLQKDAQMSDNGYKFLKFIEIGLQVQGKLLQKGIIVEYYERTLSSVMDQRILVRQTFSEPELWYILDSLASASEKLLHIPYLNFMISQVPYNEQNIMVTNEGHLRITSVAIFLANTQNSDLSFYKGLIDQAKRDKSKLDVIDNQNDEFCGEYDKREPKLKTDPLGNHLNLTSRQGVFDIGLLVLRLANLISSPDTDLEQALLLISKNYSFDLSQTLAMMLETRENRPTLAQIIEQINQIGQQKQFSNHIANNGQNDLQVSEIRLIEKSIYYDENYPLNQPGELYIQDSPVLNSYTIIEQETQKIGDSPSKTVKEISLFPTFQKIDMEPVSYRKKSSPSTSAIKNKIMEQYKEVEKIRSIQVNNTQNLYTSIYNQSTTNITDQRISTLIIKQQYQPYRDNSFLHSQNQTLDDRIQLTLSQSSKLLSDIKQSIGLDHQFNATFTQKIIHDNWETRPTKSQSQHGITQYRDYDARFWQVLNEAQQQVKARMSMSTI